MRAVDLFKSGIKNYQEAINPPYKRNDLVAVGLTVFLLLIIPLTVIGIFQPLNTNKQTQAQAPIKNKETEFLSNELLIKIKKDARGKVKEGNAQDVGIESLNNIFKENHGKGFKRVAKVGRNSSSDHDLFSWYKLTLDAPKEKAVGRLNKALSIIQTGKTSPNAKSTRANPQSVMDLQKVISKLKIDPNIEAVDLNYTVEVFVVPNDPYYSSTGSWGQTYPDMWGMKKISTETAWNQATGSANIVVAGIDTGVDRNHQDIASNMWVNTKEIPGNNKDDDSNGYVDDYLGWDFANSDNDPMDDHGHGTHTVGTIGAVGNNGLGVVGVNWNVKIMALKFLSAGGSGSLDSGIKAMQYAADMGARVSSNSWGCGCNSVAMDDAVQYEHDRGMITVVAAGNNNGDALDFSPASADYAISVAASDSNDLKASFSNWGEKIDVAAPGVDILSTRASINGMCGVSNTVGTNYCRVSGTSMATPHVAGLAALILSKNPSLTNEEVRQIIRSGATDLGAVGKDKDFGYGRISASGSIALADTKPLSPIITSPSSRTLATGVITIVGSIPGPNFKSYKVEVGIGRQPTSWIAVANSTTQVINGPLATIDPKTIPDGLNIIRVTATDTNGKIYQFQIHDILIDNLEAVISSPYSLVTLGNTAVFGAAVTKNGVVFSNYKLEWGAGSAPTSWSTAGITLANGGTQPVTNSQLGTWDTSSLTPNQQYSLRLTVYSTLSNESVVSAVLLDKDVLNGWPKIIEQDPVGGGGGLSQAMPAVADLDGDGKKEIIVAVQNKVYVFRKDGSNFPGFPVAIDATSQGFFGGAVNVADLDGDGRQEIVVQSGAGGGSMLFSSPIWVFKSDGSVMPGWPQYGHFAWYYHSPTIADLNGDGKKEIIALQDWTYGDGSGRHYILHAYQSSGEELAGFPKDIVLSKENVFPYFTSFSIADMDGDGKPEMALGFLNRVYLLDNAGNFLPSWPYTSPNQNTTTGPLPIDFKDNLGFGDIDGDGKLELVAFGGAQWQCPTCPAWWFAWKKDGSLVWGFPKTAPKTSGTYDDYLWYLTQPRHAPDLVDINGDGKDEIVGGFLYYVIIYDNASGVFTKYKMGGTGGTSVSDIDGDGKLEYTANGYCCSLSPYPSDSYPDAVIVNDDGSAYWRKGPVPQFLRPMLVADLDNDGKMEVIGYHIPPDDVVRPGILVVWTIPTAGANPAQYEWPMFGHDAARTGRLITAPPISDTQPPSTPTGLTATAVAYNKVSLSWNASTDNVGIAKYWVVRNGITIASSTTNSYTDTSVNASTTYNYQVIAADAAGNNSGSSNTATTTTPAVPDTQAPTTPTNLVAAAVSYSQINLSWTTSTDNVGVTSYDVYRNNSKITTVSTTSFGDTGLAASTTYTYFVKARDAAGNVSGASNSASATTLALPTVGTLSGQVTSASTGAPIVGAIIKVTVASSKGNSLLVGSATTNSSGFYAIQPSVGSYNVTTSASGYKKQVKVASVLVNTTTAVNFSLQLAGNK